MPIMTSSAAVLLLVLLGSAALGALFFGGLGLTVGRLAQIRRPAAWLAVSFLVRSAIVLAGLPLLMDGRWERLLAALIGFHLARSVVLRAARRAPRGRPRAAET
jgi:F1F0 ATPase subunit 2